MAVDQLSPQNPLAPPVKLVRRTARVATGALNTVRVPHDRFSDARGEWYQTGGNAPAVIEGNEVKFIIDGEDAFSEMAAAIRTANAPGHFVYMLNWFCDVDFPLIHSEEPPPPPPQTTLGGLLTGASEAGAMIRAMFYREIYSSQSRGAVLFLNSEKVVMTVNGPQVVPVKPPLKNAAAIWDQRGNENFQIPILAPLLPRGFGSQHQKVLCVYGADDLVCFCGGVDFNPDRIYPPERQDTKSGSGTGGEPLHDVHCRIRGPAALELVRLFLQRWDDHPDGKAFNRVMPRPSMPPTPASVGADIVQVGRTFGKVGYGFCPKGETTAAGMISHAIRSARRFIYTECQYFTGAPELQDALCDALRRIEHLTIVLTHWEISDLPTVNYHRKLFIGKLRQAGREKVRVFTLQPDGNTPAFQDGHVPHTYVHSKIWIIDDEFAVIGSLNSNRRCWSHDSEVAAGIYETSTDTVLHYRLAHWLRIAIWMEHLGLDSWELSDGVASAAHWLRLPAGARVRPYDLNERNRYGLNDVRPDLGFLWDGALDPS